MSVFLIADVKVTNDEWLPDYAAKVHDIVHKNGGKYLARSGNITPIEGAAPDTSVIAVLESPPSKRRRPLPTTRRMCSTGRPGRRAASVGSS